MAAASSDSSRLRSATTSVQSLRTGHRHRRRAVRTSSLGPTSSPGRTIAQSPFLEVAAVRGALDAFMDLVRVGARATGAQRVCIGKDPSEVPRRGPGPGGSGSWGCAVHLRWGRWRCGGARLVRQEVEHHRVPGSQGARS